MTAHLTSLPCDIDEAEVPKPAEPSWNSTAFSFMRIDGRTQLSAEVRELGGALYVHITAVSSMGGALDLDVSLAGSSALADAISQAWRAHYANGGA